MPTHHLQIKGQEKSTEDKQHVCFFAQTNYRNQMRKFGIKTDDRRRHMYVIGKTGMGKTTMLENMVLQDIYNGHGVGVVDPHGDMAEKLIDYIPSHRTNDVIYFNPADVEFPIGFNILEVESEEQKHLVASGLMGVFKKIWPDVWSARMEYILNNTLLALLDSQGSTLLGINRMLADKKYRRKVIRQLKDPVVKSFWTTEFANYEPRYQKEAVAPIQNKIGQFLSASVIRNMVAQVKSTINIREIMDQKKILIMNLSKGRIGEDNSRLLGGMLITEIQLAAMSRVDIPEEERNDFFLYVDEFQNFATQSFANILSEARKYRLGLIMAHQYVAQLDETVADAVFGNVGSILTFRVGAADAEALAKEYAPTFTEEHIVNLPKYQIFLKLMINGVASQPFSAVGMPPLGSSTGSANKVIRVSRERYGKSRDIIEEKITRWSGMEIAGSDSGEVEKEKKKEKNTDNKKDDDKEKIEIDKKKLESDKEDISLEDLLPKNEKAKEDDLATDDKFDFPEDKDGEALPEVFDEEDGQEDEVGSDEEKANDEEDQDLLDFFDEEQKELKDSEDFSPLPRKEKDEEIKDNEDKNSSKEEVKEKLKEDKPKKKRKRKRKRKKKNGGSAKDGSGGGNGSKKENKADSEDKPKKIDQDQIVRFDN